LPVEPRSGKENNQQAMIVELGWASSLDAGSTPAASTSLIRKEMKMKKSKMYVVYHSPSAHNYYFKFKPRKDGLCELCKPLIEKDGHCIENVNELELYEVDAYEK
jgi:hypothetical protein